MDLFNLESGNTWVFTGGINVQGGWHQTQGARNFIGHFEEHIRWEKRDNDHVGTRERYTINTAQAGQNIKSINEKFDTLVSMYQPKAVAFLAGPEDYHGKFETVSMFEEALKIFVEKVKQIGAVVILQTPVPAKEDDLNQQAHKCAQVMIEMAKEDHMIILIDHYNQCVTKGKSYSKGELDTLGHLEIGYQLMQGTIGDVTTFALDEVVETYQKGQSTLEENPYACSIKSLIQRDKDQPLRWLFIGDSITHGALHTHGYASFPQLFEQFLKDEYGRVGDVVINTAVSGATTKDQLENYKARFETYKKYVDVVFIMFGTNDCVSDVSLEAFRKNLYKIVKDIKEVGAIPVLRAPNPCLDAPSERGIRLIPYVEAIKECAKENEIILINHYDEWMQMGQAHLAMIKRGGWIAAGDESCIHPGVAGHLNMFHGAVKTLGLWNEKSQMLQLAYKLEV